MVLIARSGDIEKFRGKENQMALTFQPLKQNPPFRRGRNTSAERFTSERKQGILTESQFVASVSIERRRTERSGTPFLLMLLELPEGEANSPGDIMPALIALTRETDVIGWYKDHQVLGVIFTELGDADKITVLNSIRERVTQKFAQIVRAPRADGIHISFHFFPEEGKNPGHSADLNLYPEFSRRSSSKKVAHTAKRCMDVLASASALLLLSPVLAVIALLIKLTSKGPVFFRQTRVGQHGTLFTFLKFRSMHVNCDPGIHKEFVSQFIAGNAKVREANGNGSSVYKITNDPRVTTLGRVLRKTSLDELPQFINVLTGKMSLIGPRPPVPYEFESYDIWHRRRVLEIKPGITGLWQVSARSKTSFDDMVRLDLQYARDWSLWLDLKILLKTPNAVLSGDGAY